MEILHLSQFADYLKPRPSEFHKGNAGKVLVIGGDYGYSGAPLLAAMAALRVGAGLVRIATRPEYALTINMAHPEIMCVGIQVKSDLENFIAKAIKI